MASAVVSPSARPAEPRSTESPAVVIVGAGPYGLSAAAALDGLAVTFGRPMSFWSNHMPRGMLLRSPREASNLYAPNGSLQLEDYERSHALQPQAPLPLSTFVRYGLWFQQQAVPSVDQRTIVNIERGEDGFRVALEDGTGVSARRVVIATGIGLLAWRPPVFSELPPERVTHSVDHSDLSRYAGTSVAVIGAGQSAIESAALLAEQGARVEVIARAEQINWLVRSSGLHHMKAARRLLYGPSDIGPAGVSWLVEWPRVMKRIPRTVRVPLAARAIRPAASAWLVPRVSNVRLSLGCTVVEARMANGGVMITLDDGTTRVVDHVLLATGYRVDLARYSFLSPSLRARIAVERGFPVLGRGFESSVAGLHFIGAPAAWSFGPLFRFVAGAGYAARALERVIRNDRPLRAPTSLRPPAADLSTS